MIRVNFALIANIRATEAKKKMYMQVKMHKRFYKPNKHIQNMKVNLDTILHQNRTAELYCDFSI